ncbi:MAG: carbamoyl phosphate synthase large subunit, partial [Myxococcota bacterium]
LLSIRSEEHEAVVEPIRDLVSNGFKVVATSGTARCLRSHGIDVDEFNKVHEGSPHTVDHIENGGVDVVMNTAAPDPKAIADSYSMRRAALLRGIPYFTTLPAIRAAAGAIRALRNESIGVRSLQEIHARMEADRLAG